MLTLYFTPGSSSLAAHIALHEVGVPFEVRLISLVKGEQRNAEFLARNPLGKVPLLLIDGRPLTEVAGILWYLARRFPEAGLLPAGGPEAEAQVVSWMSFVASTLHPARGAAMEQALAAFGVAETRLGERDWAVGAYSIADIHLFRLFWRFTGSRHPAPGTFPRLEAHAARVMARPAVRRTFEAEAAVGYELPG